MQSAKHDALATISAMPDDATIEQIHYRLYVLEHIRAGVADLEAGRCVPHEEVEAELSKWFAD